MTGTVLILGANGKTGAHSAAAFSRAGWTVRRFTRGEDMTQAAQGADVIVNGLNPPDYHDWARQIPAITEQVLAAARASGATVIVPGTVYPFAMRGGIWSELTPHLPATRKGRIRAQMEADYRDSGVQTIVLRAGSFIDPDGQGDVMSRLHLREIAKGRITALGPTDMFHAFCYLPDWADAAVGLAAKRSTLDRFEDIPFPGHAFTINDLKDALEAGLGRPLKVSGFPWALLWLASPVWELGREMYEMRALWRTPHMLDGTRLTALLPDFKATPLHTVMTAGLPRAAGTAP